MTDGDETALKSLLRRPMPQCDPNNNYNQMRESPLCMAAKSCSKAGEGGMLFVSGSRY